VQAVELDDGGRVKCDPGSSPGNPTDVYTTPVIINDSSSSNEHVAIWTERNVTSPGSNQGYFFVRFEPRLRSSRRPMAESMTGADGFYDLMLGEPYCTLTGKDKYETHPGCAHIFYGAPR
jgi:hypothetical protein